MTITRYKAQAFATSQHCNCVDDNRRSATHPCGKAVGETLHNAQKVFHPSKHAAPERSEPLGEESLSQTTNRYMFSHLSIIATSRMSVQ